MFKFGLPSKKESYGEPSVTSLYHNIVNGFFYIVIYKCVTLLSSEI